MLFATQSKPDMENAGSWQIEKMCNVAEERILRKFYGCKRRAVGALVPSWNRFRLRNSIIEPDARFLPKHYSTFTTFFFRIPHVTGTVNDSYSIAGKNENIF